MSEKAKLSTSYYFAAGVFKIDSMAAGFPDLIKIAQEWSKDENFYEIIVRQVSESNYGIQFVYYTVNPQAQDSIKIYKKQLEERFGKDFYAWDYQTSSSESLDRLKKMVVISKKLELN